MSKPLFLQIGGDEHYAGMIKDHERRHRLYCEKWGYEYRVVETLPPTAWFKFEVALEAMSRHIPNYLTLMPSMQVQEVNADDTHSYIFLVDADCIVVDFDKDMRDTLPEHASLALTVHPYPSGFDMFHWQVGMTYWKNTQAARDILEAVIDAREKWPLDTGWNEQEALNQLLQSYGGKWQAHLRTLPYWWNNNTHDMPTGREIVAAFHGYGTPGERRQVMREYARAHPYPGQIEALPCGCKNLSNIGYDNGVKCLSCGAAYGLS